MSEIVAQYLGDLRVKNTHVANGEIMFTDASAEIHGKEEGFTPVDVLAAALGSCAVTTMGVYANTHGLDVTGTTVEISFAMSEKSPRRVERVELIFTMPDREYSAKDKQSLERAAGACPVHNSLHPDMEQRFVFKWAK